MKTETIHENKKGDSTAIRFVEKMPEFPGGASKFYEYLTKELKYPKNCMEKGISGKVIVEFVIERNGSISNVKVVTKVHPELDAEAIRVIKGSPNWIPGEQLGKPVRVFYTIPINFSLK